ncbi:hypothetical protein SRHO_G00137030 [Serrasalmus rhombeus]
MSSVARSANTDLKPHSLKNRESGGAAVKWPGRALPRSPSHYYTASYFPLGSGRVHTIKQGTQPATYPHRRQQRDDCHRDTRTDTLTTDSFRFLDEAEDELEREKVFLSNSLRTARRKQNGGGFM